MRIMKTKQFYIDRDEIRERFYVMDSEGNMHGNLSGFHSEEDAQGWIDQSKNTPRYRCLQCKRVWFNEPTWTGEVSQCPVCQETNAVLKRIV